MRQATTNDKVTVLIAYADRERRRRMGPALILFREAGTVCAGFLVDDPGNEDWEGTHGQPVEFLERLSGPGLPLSA